jgi:hypothetical protein
VVRDSGNRSDQLAELVTPDSMEALSATLINLTAGQAICISADDFKKLTGHEITEFASEGRLMMGNLSARANCTVETTNCTAVFTKNPALQDQACGRSR